MAKVHQSFSLPRFHFAFHLYSRRLTSVDSQAILLSVLFVIYCQASG